MAIISCPSCGEEEVLAGDRIGGSLWITRERCGERWERDARAKCPTCGRDDLRSFQEPLIQRARGNAYSIVGSKTIALCPLCDSEEIEKRVPDASKRYAAPEDPR